MTSLSESKQENEVHVDLKQSATNNELTTNGADSCIADDQRHEQTSANPDVHEDRCDEAPTQATPPIVTVDGEQPKEATEPTVHTDDDENRSKRSAYSRVKYSPSPQYRSAYGMNGHLYAVPPPPPPPSSPYYYYSVSPLEKPAPLMFVPAQQQQSPSRSSTSPSSHDNSTGNAANASPSNLPPRLRQASAAETDSNSQATSTVSQPPAITNGRRHRSIFPRGLNAYYAPHPPPLMATPPGVLYPYPPAVHQPGHIAYNIRPPDEYELYALQQQLIPLPPQPVIWSAPPGGLPAHGHPSFAPYALNGLPPAYVYNPASVGVSPNSFLNPDAAEWVPPPNGHESSSSDEQILIDDEVNFPPLSSTASNAQAASSKDQPDDSSEQIEAPSEVTPADEKQSNETSSLPADNSDVSTSSNPKIDLPNGSSSSQEDTAKPLPTSPTKVTPTVSYSTIISQMSDTQKQAKPLVNGQPPSRQQQAQPAPTNHVQNQLPPRERTNKPAQAQPQSRSQPNAPATPNPNSRRRQPFNSNGSRMATRNLLPTDASPAPKPPTPVNDDWIEVKSKKTKKFDRGFNDSSTEKFLIEEQMHKSVSPALSLTSTGDNTTATFTSEDDFDDKDNQDLAIDLDNEVANDYNQIVIDEIHNRLDNNEQLLIIMRGCPGSGKTTLAKSLSQGYNGLILSTDDYFTDRNLNKYVFDLNKLDDAHRYNRRRASDALKRNVSPVIIDNTNTQVWEMKPYVAMGVEANYDVLLIEPQTPWRYKARDLFKRNRHNLPMKRIRDMLNRFEHDVSVQSIVDQLATVKKPTPVPAADQNTRSVEPEPVDPVLTSKKTYDTIDDSLILNDVRLCINDMILFLTSSFYQTALLSSTLTLPTTTTTTTSPTSTPLSVSFHDLSLIPSPTTSLPSTPSTPHGRFPRTIPRFPSTTGQDLSFSAEHKLRASAAVTTLPRSLDAVCMTPPLSAQSSLIAKKRRKNKSKPAANELVLNTNNSNNNNNNGRSDAVCIEQTRQAPLPIFHVVLPEDDVNFAVIEEQNDTTGEKSKLQSDFSRDPTFGTSPQRDARFHQARQVNLHGLHSDEAVKLLEQLELNLETTNSTSTTSRPFELLTGSGHLHSTVLAHLKKRNATYSDDGQGVILLQSPNASN